MKFLAVVFLLGLIGVPVQEKEAAKNVSVELNEILKTMAAHEEWQDRHLIEYQVQRKFYAENKRFKMESVLEVNTVFRRPNQFDSEVVRSEGSKIIRERVFDKILDAEKESRASETKDQVKITPANYNFELIGKERCGDRICNHLRIVPKKKDKFSLIGQIWVDDEDGAMIRITGSPAKRPSFWTTNTQIERRYRRIDGVWLCEAMESVSDILIGGRSTLKIDYNYVAIHTEGNG